MVEFSELDLPRWQLWICVLQVHDAYQSPLPMSPPEEFLHELMGKITANAHRIIERVAQSRPRPELNMAAFVEGKMCLESRGKWRPGALDMSRHKTLELQWLT